MLITKKIENGVKRIKHLLKKPQAQRTKVIALITGCVFMCFFLFVVVKFLYENNKSRIGIDDGTGNNSANNRGNKSQERPVEAVVHKIIETKVNGLEQVINILEIHPASDKVKIKPVLSHNSLYGFEFLSEMVERHKAYAAVNGGFFYEYGDPSGMVVIDGEIITASTGKYPVFIISNGKVELKEIETKLWMKSDKTVLELDGINAWGKAGEWIIFTRKYGTTNKTPDGINKPNITIVIEDNVITRIIKDSGETEIPKNGMLLAYIKPERSTVYDNIPFTIGERVEFSYQPFLGTDGQAYECGSWIIKDGEIVIGERDPWIGVLTNRDPRTAIGIKESGEVVLFTVDGRQPGYSYGFTGQELGEFLREYGVKYAAMLDGGASTEMIINGKIVNRPSFKGTERPLAGGIIVEYDE